MKNWLKLLTVILFFAVISVISYFILRAFGLTDIEYLKGLIVHSKQYGWIIFFLLEVLLFVCFSFIPMLDTAMCILGTVLFGPIVNFFISTLAEIVSCSIMFFLGDKFGEHLAIKLIGKKELEHVQDMVDSQSKLLLPIFFLIPIIPEEALSLVAGMTKMKYWYFLIVTIITKSIEVAIVCFLGSGIINWSVLTIVDWFVLINIVLIDIFLVIKYRSKIENIFKRKKKKKRPKTTDQAFDEDSET